MEKAQMAGGYGRGNGPTESNTCRHCGQRGHFARECPIRNGSATINNEDDEFSRTNFIRSQRIAMEQLSRNRDGAGGGGVANEERRQQRQPVTYMPLEAHVDQLWGQHIAPGANFDRLFHANVSVEVTGTDPHVNPITSFEAAGLTPLLLENVKKCGYVKPTPIQQQAIPLINRGRDLMACAQTGSGKTAAYLLPILSAMLRQGDVGGGQGMRQEPICLILTPTRELAVQVKDEARKFACGTMVNVAVIYGGTNVRAQFDSVQRGCNMLVATPGRLMQFVDEGRICLRRCRFLVLDEADRMLDMGFERVIRRLIDLPEMPPKGVMRQTLMFSATFPTEIQRLAQDFMHQYIFVTIGKRGGANEDIVQEVIMQQGYAKYERLYDLLTQGSEGATAAGGRNGMKTLVFVERKRVADFVASRLSQMGLTTTSIHGDREQREREEALRDFKTGRCPVLVATAVASRGLDIVGVDHVINFDLPSTVDDYVHRIGRTGRVGNIGRATSFYDPKTDKPLAAALLQVLRDAQQVVPDWLIEEAGTAGGNTQLGGRGDLAANYDPW